MLRVGLTGAAGAGKSTVAAGLADHGIAVIDADRVAHELYRPGGELVNRLEETFGPSVITEDGEVDRAALADIVFTDAAARQQLNRLVHPPLVQELERRWASLEQAGETVAVLEAALLLEWGPPPEIRLIVAVIAPRETRLARLVARGLSPEDARRRLDLQVSEQELLAAAHIVVDNHGDRDSLRRQIDGLSNELRRRAGAA